MCGRVVWFRAPLDQGVRPRAVLECTTLILKFFTSPRRPREIVLATPLLVTQLFSIQEASAFEHRHGLGVGYQFGHVSAESGDSYNLQSLPLSYLGRYGDDWAAMTRLSLLIPLQASDGEQSFLPQSEYDRTRAFDIILGPNYRFTQIGEWTLEAGFGPHFNYTRFQSTEYVEWTNAALGLAGSWGARRKWGTGFSGGMPEVGVQLDVSYDFIDLAHGGDLGSGLQGQALVSLGWALGVTR